jgi:hypothetical protein
MPTPELNAFTRLLLRLRNAVDYPLRQNLRLQRGGPILYRNPEAELFAVTTARRRTAAQSLAARLSKQYHLQDFRADSSPSISARTCFTCICLKTPWNWLSQPLENRFKPQTSVFRTGFMCKHGCRPALVALPDRPGRQLTLHGYEVDAYRFTRTSTPATTMPWRICRAAPASATARGVRRAAGRILT